MQKFQYRARSRLIAIVDLVLTILSLWIPLMILIAAIGFSVLSKNEKLQDKVKEAMAKNPELSKITRDSDFSSSVQFAAAIVWITFVVAMIVLIIQLVAAVRLLNSTTVGKRPSEAAKLAAYWRNVTIVFTILLVIEEIVTLSGVGIESVIYGHLFTWGSIILRCIGIYVVHLFVSELEEATVRGTLQSHDGQLPMTDGMPKLY